VAYLSHSEPKPKPKEAQFIYIFLHNLRVMSNSIGVHIYLKKNSEAVKAIVGVGGKWITVTYTMLQTLQNMNALFVNHNVDESECLSLTSKRRYSTAYLAWLNLIYQLYDGKNLLLLPVSSFLLYHCTYHCKSSKPR
jgi:hypothetical protein